MAVQPPVSKWIPIATMVGILAGGTVLVGNMLSSSLSWMGPLIWVPFISWALYFMAGGMASRLHKYALALIGGVIFGWLTIILGNMLVPVVGGLFAYPIVVFCVAFTIVMLELTDWFELAPAYFFGYAGYFAAAFGFSKALGFEKPEDLTLVGYHIALTLLGLFLGWLTVTIKVQLLNMMGVPPDQRQTVFDRES